jgi:hypothetical protein
VLPFYIPRTSGDQRMIIYFPEICKFFICISRRPASGDL